jgi:hypothetical protein
VGQLKNILGIVLVLVLLIAAYLVFRTDILRTKVDGADLVSANAVFVFETYEPVSVWNQLVNQPIWSRMTELPALKSLEAQLIHLDSLAGKSGNLDKAFKGHKFTVSLHPVGREEYGFLFSVTFQDRGFLEFLKDMETRMSGQVNVKTRNYSGVTIYESTPRTSHGKTFTYAVYKNVLIGSYASFLVEDGIRFGMSGELKSFRERFPHLYKHQPQPSGIGVLRITGNGFAGLVDAVSSEKGDVLVRELSDNGFSANLLPGFTDTSVLLRGDLFVDGETGFTSRVGRKFNKTVFANQISNRTAVLYQYLIDNLTDFKFPVNKAFEARSTVKAELEEEFAVEAFFSTLSGEIALLTIGHVGNYAAQVCDRLAEKNISLAHYDMRFVKPIDEEILHEVFTTYKKVITVEDGCIQGGFGSAVLEFMADNNYQAEVRRLGIPDRVVEHGEQIELQRECGFDPAGIEKSVMDVLESVSRSI